MSELLTFILSHEDQFRRARLPSLYSDFQLQYSTNPDGYAANATAWETALAHALKAGKVPGGHDILSLRTGPELLRALETKEWGRPLALGTVVDEAIQNGRMFPLKDFLGSPKSIYSSNWILHPQWVLSWGLKQLGLGGKLLRRGNLQTGQFVITSNLEQASQRVVDSLGSPDTRIDRILPVEAFREKAAKSLCLDQGLTENDLSILLIYLSRDKMQIAFNDQIVKLRGPGEDTLSISNEDIAVASLKSLINLLKVQLSQLSDGITDLSEKTRLALMQKDRLRALANLRSRKLRENLYKSRSVTLYQLEEVYNKIEEAADQVEIIRVMKASTHVLSGLNAEVGGLEKVENVIECLKEEMNKADDINNALSEAGQDTAGLDEGAIDDELEFLEQEQQKKNDEEHAQQVRRKLESVDNTALSQTLLSQEPGSTSRDKIPNENMPVSITPILPDDKAASEAQYS